MERQTDTNTRFSHLRRALSSPPLSGATDQVDAVVAVLLNEGINSELCTLLIHRAERAGDPWSGQIALPGGKVRKSDSTTRGALRREILEEIGVEISEVGVELGSLSVSSPMRNLDVKVQPWVYGIERRPEVKIGSEVQEAFWVSLSRLPAHRDKAEIEIRGVRRSVDAFIIDGRVVWGFTHRVLNELLAILGIA